MQLPVPFGSSVAHGGDPEDSKAQMATGFLKVTPAHDPNDYELGQRHDLAMINIMEVDGRLNDQVPEAYRGLDRYEARKRVVADIEETTRSIRKAIQDAERMAGTPINEVYAGIAGEHVHGRASTGVVAVGGKEITARDIEGGISTRNRWISEVHIQATTGRLWVWQAALLGVLGIVELESNHVAIDVGDEHPGLAG